ncbi:MAG: hypothetical protein E4G99_08170 [Anaerolineales bacterium]|nr:MAG: hypothetical protein E4G99_08170 [Anaerolineales bacterium]
MDSDFLLRQLEDANATMPSKTIVLWGQGGLLVSSVELLLAMNVGWNVISIPVEQNGLALIQAVDDLNPDVVIIQKDHPRPNSQLPARLIQSHSGLKVITLNLTNNFMEVYSKQSILIRSAADLISAIESGPVNSKHQ